MKFLIASDIHGSAEYAGKLLEIFRKENPDQILLLGDLLYHGPRNDLPDGYNPKKVIEILKELQDYIIAVRGNCEAEVDQMVLPFSCLSESALVFADKKKIYMTHGHIYSMDKHPSGMDIFMQGHTHIPVLEKRDDGIVYLNPGSVSIPKGGSERGYAMWVDGRIELRELLTDKVIKSLETQE